MTHTVSRAPVDFAADELRFAEQPRYASYTTGPFWCAVANLPRQRTTAIVARLKANLRALDVRSSTVDDGRSPGAEKFVTGVSDSSASLKPSATANAAGISLREASLSYRGKVVFEDLDLDLQAGRMTCLLGPSGVGKSSLLRYIAGLTGMGSDASVSGRLSFSGAGDTSQIAYLAQQDLLLPWLSVLDNVILGSRLRGERADRNRALSLLDQVGLRSHEDDRPVMLSGGMRQRVALARTLMEDRPFVLMDEPFSALDAITRFELQELASTLLAGKTTLLVTHDPLEALRIGHRLLLLTGSPARFETPIDPPGAPLRNVADPDIARLQTRIMQRLTAAKEIGRIGSPAAQRAS